MPLGAVRMLWSDQKGYHFSENPLQDLSYTKDTVADFEPGMLVQVKEVCNVDNKVSPGYEEMDPGEVGMVIKFLHKGPYEGAKDVIGPDKGGVLGRYRARQ